MAVARWQRILARPIVIAVAVAAAAAYPGVAAAVPTRPAPATGLLWYKQSSGEIGEWLLNGTNHVTGIRWWALNCQTITYGCHDKVILGLADFNHNGSVDVVSNSPTRIGIDFDARTSATAYDEVHSDCGGNCDWKPVAVGDFNDDGNPDIMWHRYYLGTLSAWLVDGNYNHVGYQNLDWSCAWSDYPGPNCFVDWKVIGVGDMNGDGHQDLVWYHRADGYIGSWILNGYGNVVYAQYVDRTCSASRPWTCADQMGQPQAIADMNGDGHQDVVWWNTGNTGNGKIRTWFLDGSGHVTGVGELDLPCEWGNGCGQDWKIIGVVDPALRVPDLPICTWCLRR